MRGAVVRGDRSGAGASPPSDADAGAPRVVLLLPLAFLLHAIEEWLGGFPTWTARVVGEAMAPERFLLLNGIGLALFTACALAAVRDRGAAWIGVALAALLGLNALLHLGLSTAYGSYAPGVVTGVVLYLPLSGRVLWQSHGRLSGRVFAGAVLCGVAVQALVPILALV